MNRQNAIETKEFILDLIDLREPPKNQINSLIRQIIDGLTINRVCDKCKHFTLFTSGKRYCTLNMFYINDESGTSFDEYCMGCDKFEKI